MVGLPDGLGRLTTLKDVDELPEVPGRSHPNGDTSIPTTVILAAGLPIEMSTVLRTTSELRARIVAVVSGLAPRSGDWSLHLEDALLLSGRRPRREMARIPSHRVPS